MIFPSLRRHGVLGINRRIGEFILTSNKRKHYPTVDDKVLTNKIMQEAGIPAPDIYAALSSVGELRKLDQLLKGLNSFVAKPARGAMGNGIMVVDSIKWGETPKDTILTTVRKNQIDMEAFKYFLSGIISGLYSLGGHVDQVIIQQRLRLHPAFSPIVYAGIPDVRVIVFNGYPVMSMIRLPTKKSGGRGNLHQGAVGAGIDLVTGRITHAVLGRTAITKHPDTDADLIGIEIPFWPEILETATRCSDAIRLGYFGADIVVDPAVGPQVLELNARPGLAIQLANKKGLIPVLQEVRTLSRDVPVQERAHWRNRVKNSP